MANLRKLATQRVLSANQVAALAESVGLPGRSFSQLAKGESGRRPGAIGHDPGGTRGLGLFQITTKYNDDVIKRFGGEKAMLNPVQNAKAAKAIYDRQGIKAWYGTKYLTNPNAHYKGPGVNDLNAGDLSSVALGHKSVFDKQGFQQAQKEFVLNRLLTSNHGEKGTVMQRVGLLGTTDPAREDFTRSRLTSKINPGSTDLGLSFPPGSGKRGRVQIAPGANRAGVGVQPIVKQFLSGAAGLARQPITVTTGTNHDRNTVNGNVSDHWDGHGADIAVPVDSRKGDQIAAAALREAGVPRKKAMQMARQGGLYTLNHNGRRIQVIWKTNEGGNHHNHVHVGIR